MSTSTVEVAPAGRTPQGSPPAPPSLLRLIGVELRKSYDTRAGFWLLLVIAIAALAVVLLALFFDDAPSKTFGDYFGMSQFPVGLLLPVLGILLVTSEWSQRTALTTFTLVPRRSRVLLAKVLAATVLALLGVAAAAVASVVAAALTPVFSDAGVQWELTGAQLGQVVLIQVLTVLVGVAFGMLLLSSPLAIVLYFVLPTAFTVLVNTVAALDWVRTWLDLSTTTMPMYTGDLAGQGWAQLGTSAALWFLLPLVLGWWRIERTEIA